MNSGLFNNVWMIQNSKLSISLHEAEFSKDYQYMLTAQFENQKKQTDVSALARNPIFINNNLIFDLHSPHTIQGLIVFAAHMIVSSEEGYENGKQNTRILGECSLDLSPFALQPTQTYNLPIRQQLKFMRTKDGKQVTVGRFIASIKIIKEDALPTFLQDLQTKKIERNEYFSELPPFDPKFGFQWRIRLEIREALNVPYNNGLPAQMLVETGWTEYRDSVPEQNRLFSSSILPGPHPEWNQTILITNPVHIAEPKGFLMVSVKDEHNLQDLFRVYLPVQSMVRFVPYNLKMIKANEQSPNSTQFYMSVILQAPIDRKDQLVDLVVQDINFQPSLTPFKQICLATVLNNDYQPKINFLQFNPKQDTIERVLEFDQAEEFHYILSAAMRVPPIKTGNYKAAAVITLSQALLRKRISVFLVAKSSKGQYTVVGVSENVQNDLVGLVVQKTKKKLFLSVRNHPNAKFGTCQLQICPPFEDPLASSRASEGRGQQTASQRLMKQLNFTTNQSMLRHVSQNNEIISRILKELDDKSESLRQAAAEISNLRGRVKLLQNQNGILRQQALREEDELVNLVQRQVENMSLRDLKEKIVKISQLYKLQRVKNRELDRTVKTMEPQISNTMQLNSIIVAQKNNIQTLNDKISRMAKEHERINVYKETIRKQEKVIAKLETVMKEGIEEVRNARRTKLELEELKKKQGNAISRAVSRGQERQQIQRLQAIIAQLQNAKKDSRIGGTAEGSSNYELQFKLHQAETRIASLEHELQQNSRSYARELAMLKMKLAQKQAVMDGYRN